VDINKDIIYELLLSYFNSWIWTRMLCTKMNLISLDYYCWWGEKGR